jgi:hypothetical protein
MLRVLAPHAHDFTRSFIAGGCLFAALLLPVQALADVQPPSPMQLALAEQAIDKQLIVDCLLPGQVRRLGTGMTYLSARRPAKLSADECGLRGGEYVMYDRASLDTALSAWLPLANGGDPEAQTYVGELYERGIGGQPPNFAEAARWYRKAADQGFARGRINLGFLYEKGLGVERDPAAALQWYRKAAGLGESIALDSGETAASREDARQLRRELEDTKRQLDEARRELERVRRGTHSELQQLQDQIRRAQDAGDRATALGLDAQLREREAELARRDRQVAELSAAAEQYRRRLDALESETSSLREQLVEARNRLNDSEGELDARRARASEDERRLQALQVQLDRQRKQTGDADTEAKRRLEAQLRVSEQELANQRKEIARVESEARAYKAKLEAIEARRSDTAKPAATAVAMAPPSIQLIDPPVMVTRGPTLVRIRGTAPQRELVGKVTAPAGLLSFTVNDVSQGTDEQGLFKAPIPMRVASTPVSLVAVDRNGQRAALDFTLVPEGAEAAPPQPPPAVPRLNFGRYHALVVGNQAYRQLPKLETAIADARAVADILANKYGFKVTLLTDATRYEFLSAMNKLRSELTENDNLVIYYAGHGEIDRANQRGHWLPVDAEPSSDANWISNVSITDILNAMSVKHAMVIADSCYSGTLTRSSIGQLDVGVSPEARAKWLKAIIQARTRTVLTSGGVQPVLDGGGGQHSVFAKSLIEVLTENQDALEAQRLYREVAARVLDRASRFQMDQRPEYAPMKFAGHESGDFLFVPKVMVASSD